MRILVITYEFPPVGGGGGRAAQDVCIRLARNGHEVAILTAHYGDLPKYMELEGVKIHRVVSGRSEAFRAGLKPMVGFALAGSLAAARLARRWKPDIMQVHFAVPSGPAGWLAHRLTGIPYVLTAHLGDVPGGVPEKTGRWFRYIYPLTPPIWKEAAAVTAVSDYTRQIAQNHYPVEITVIPNGVDLNELDPGEIRLGNPPRIVFAGRFMPQKNLLQLVHSLNEVRQLPWNCTLLGDGPVRAELEVEIQRLDLSERFSLPGWVTPEEVIQEFSRSDILFMPSLSEGLPVVGVQSLAMGLAVVCSDAGGLVDVVEDGVNGFLIQKLHPEGYALALARLLSDRSMVLTYRLASRVLAKKFDLDGVVEAYTKVFQHCLSRERGWD